MSEIWPTDIKVSKDRRQLTVVFEGGARFELQAEALRVLSPSAEVQGHSPEQRVTVPGKRNVTITRVEPVGNYAIRIGFDDLHDSGIYTWTYLHTLGERAGELFAQYEAELAEKGLSRDQFQTPR